MLTSNNKNAQLSMLTSNNKRVVFKKKLYNCRSPPPTTKDVQENAQFVSLMGTTTNTKDVQEISPLSMLTSNNKHCRGKSTIGVIKLKH
jgi:hypothetical protein